MKALITFVFATAIAFVPIEAAAQTGALQSFFHCLRWLKRGEYNTGEAELRRNVLMQGICQGCNARLRIEFITEPTRTGAMWTVDCPVCGTSKMIPDEPVKIYYEKDGNWIETQPKTQHFA